MSSPGVSTTPQKSKNGPWLKRVLVPFWVIQDFFMLLLIAVVAFALSIEDEEGPRRVTFASYIIFLLVCSLCLILNITEHILFGRRNLQPLTYLMFNIVKCTTWLIIFCISCANFEKESGLSWYGGLNLIFGGFIENLIVLLAFVGSLIYASVIFHRQRISHHQYSAYNPQGYGPTSYHAPLNPTRDAYISNPSSPTTASGFHQGPYTESGFTTANYSKPDSDGTRSTQSPTTDGTYSTVPRYSQQMTRGGAEDNAPIYDEGGHQHFEALKGSRPYPGPHPQENRVEMSQDAASILPTAEMGSDEVFELATAKSPMPGREGKSYMGK
ncbi:hypothetical protein MMC09_004699 [Bachmanniomyces sp. S44760]|nr:hypothetical protein [Bachmanniomyces sp. S44760]